MVTLAQATQLSEQRLVKLPVKFKALVQQILAIGQRLGLKLIVLESYPGVPAIEVAVLYSDEERMMANPLYSVMFSPMAHGTTWFNGDSNKLISETVARYVQGAYKAIETAVQGELKVAIKPSDLGALRISH